MNLNKLVNILASTADADKPIIDGSKPYDWAGAGITILVSILIVFIALIIIIIVTHLLFLALNKTKEAIDKSDSKFARFLKRKKGKKAQNVSKTPVKVEIVDDDMMAAVLVATIDYQAEVKSDVRLVSVKEIK